MSKVITPLAQAKQFLSNYFPLPGFIATNPLWDRTNQAFHQAMVDCNLFEVTRFYANKIAAEQLSKQSLHSAIDELSCKQEFEYEWTEQNLNAFLHDVINHDDCEIDILYAEQLKVYQFNHAKRWVKEQCLEQLLNFFGQNQNDKGDFLAAWQQHHLDSMSELTTEQDEIVFIEQHLAQLGIPENLYQAYLLQISKALYGWGSLIKWLNARPLNPWVNKRASANSIFILWLHYESLLQQKTGFTYQPADISSYNQRQLKLAEALSLLQYAYDADYRDQLTADLRTKQMLNRNRTVPKAQFIFCIDTRSEGFRRHLEAQGHYETYGFAGFFGFAFQLQQGGESSSLQCPALLDPDELIQVQQATALFCEQQSEVAQATKKNLFSPYAWFELSGLWLLPLMVVRTLLPTLYQKWLNKRFENKTHHLVKQLSCQGLSQLTELANAAEGFLNTIGLVSNFASDIFICAHQSSSQNNPFAATLDCGACGGNSGIPNAVIATAALNNSAVREALKKRGIKIPATTRFRAACHHTVRDELEIYDREGLSHSLLNDIALAGLQLKQERMAALPRQVSKLASARQKEGDWAELIPEMGLINNAAIIVGPRRFTEGLNLQRRTFLHSYEPELDVDGAILQGILSAPVIVAHWINAQYYFSTIDSKQFGAGNKTIHNVIPNLGVMEGNLSDLKIGLPEQSVAFQGEWFHRPQRLTVILYAKQSIVDQVLESNSQVKALVDGLWINLVVHPC